VDYTLVFSDPHTHVGDDLTRFDLLNRFIKSDRRIGQVICGGDFLSLDSCSTHEIPGSLADRQKPLLKDEIAVGLEASRRLTKGLQTRVHFTMVGGNHEDRLWRFMCKHPSEMSAENPGDLKHLLKYDKHWDAYYNYKEFFHGWGFQVTHIPHTVMGRPIGGSNASRTVGLHSGRDTLYGHCHTFQVLTVPLLNGAKRTVVSLPSFMEPGYVPPYAKNLMTGWSNGFVVIGHNDDGIDSVRYVSNTELSQLME
jgi:hypothetical protein